MGGDLCLGALIICFVLVDVELLTTEWEWTIGNKKDRMKKYRTSDVNRKAIEDLFVSLYLGVRIS